ncbi:hypothetical protein Bca52824_051356 [Brassica carinata]|uniref:Uncharacterized protein n=1 Tax=Brassica carinata TaxID=52824 RepID=A0A8X7R1K3_BRACI|nr:hypothetical protein Bca52824_051356 [Brassica carinata]
MTKPQSNKQHLDILLGHRRLVNHKEALVHLLLQRLSIPHGTIGATGGHRVIALSNSTDISYNLFRYTAPEEVTSVIIHHEETRFRKRC